MRKSIFKEAQELKMKREINKIYRADPSHREKEHKKSRSTKTDISLLNEISAMKKSNMKKIDIAKAVSFFFSGFFPHSGSSYDNKNMRVHFLCSHLDHNVDTVATSIVDFVDEESSDTDYETKS
ncbi:hypothetical protein O9G_004090 [Rozella allomycis CSF55]|uniref:Uncharacterized protein n=1 Tax=Rozella allomycis (strain CSF55) TaxID=988480 RepID=A0A075AW99_ROZAC|nr:hypothetical protein O9G_004090 [Rozella allomycis CSF55]|eukprot:EPZ32819.1 hypothetical protein O9G_004090 [Rozella allomycis CSF55]